MPLLIKTHYKLARTAIRENRTRSFLTCLGIAIGVASIILILSLMGSISNLIKQEVSNIGSDLIVVRPSTAKDEITNIIEELTSANSFQIGSLNLGDVAAISQVDGVAAVAPIAVSVNTVSAEQNTISSVPVLGTTSDFIKIEALPIRYGSFFAGKDDAKAVVLGHTLSLTLFNTLGTTIGHTINIMGEKFMVVGVLEEIDKSINFDNIDFDNAMIMSAKNLSDLTGTLQIQQINIKAINTDSLEAVSNDIRDALINQKLGDQNFSVAYGDDITHPASALFTIVSGILSIVAAISLVVGGIGVMNIMLVSVAERNHEIGVRKAVGASGRNILVQFLFESLILSFTGGLLGLVLGYVLAFFISVITPFAPFISWQIILSTFVTTFLVGLIFGIYPALKAASKNPIDSLKHYR